MDDREKVLGALREGPQGAGELSQLCGIARNTMFSLLMKMEKDNLIVWDQAAWRLADSSGQRGTREGDQQSR